MKKYFVLLSLAFGLILAAQVQAQTQETSAQTNPKDYTHTVTFKVEGMTCDGCANHVQSELGKQEGILEKEVSFPKNMAVVKFDPAKISEAEIIKTIEGTGYKAEAVEDSK